MDVTKEIEQRAQQAAQAGADHCALCSISRVTSTLASVYTPNEFDFGGRCCFLLYESPSPLSRVPTRVCGYLLPTPRGVPVVWLPRAFQK